MTIKPFIKAIAAMAVSGMMLNASANSVGIDAVNFDSDAGTLTVTVGYDFTDFAMFGGGMDLIYDSSAVAFDTYTQAPLQADAQDGASPLGSHDLGAGAYVGFGVGTFVFQTGMNSAGPVGTFVFNVMGDPARGGTTPCGMTLCLQVNSINPFVSLAGSNVSDELIANGISGYNIAPIPVPAAVWFMLSGLGALLGFGRKSA